VKRLGLGVSKVDWTTTFDFVCIIPKPQTPTQGWSCNEKALIPAFIDSKREREFFIVNLLVRIHFIIVMIRWTGLAGMELQRKGADTSLHRFEDPLHLPHYRTHARPGSFFFFDITLEPRVE